MASSTRSDRESGSDKELESDGALPRQPQGKKKSVKATAMPGKKKKSAVDLSTNTESSLEKVPVSQSKDMVVQMLGEADLEQFHVDDVSRYKDNLRKLHGLEDGEDMDQLLAELRDSHLLMQVDARLIRLLGMRCSRLTWDSKNLYDKDGEDTQRTPHRIRVVPTSNNPSNLGPRGTKREFLGRFRNCSFCSASL